MLFPSASLAVKGTNILLRQIASLGAILVIGGLAVDPLSQQLVHYRTRNVPGSIGSATIPSTIEWYSGGQDTNTLGEI